MSGPEDGPEAHCACCHDWEQRVFGLDEKLAKSEALTAEAVAREAARWRAHLSTVAVEMAQFKMEMCGTRGDYTDAQKNWALKFDAISYILSSNPYPDWLAHHEAEVRAQTFEEVRHYVKGIFGDGAGAVDEFCTRKIISIGGTFDEQRKYAGLRFHAPAQKEENP